MWEWLASGMVGVMATGGAAVSGLGALAAYARRRYAVTRRPDDVLAVRTADGWDLRMLHYRPHHGAAEHPEPVVLCHGLAANSFALDLDEQYSLARHLASRGFHAFVPDLRGRHGSWPSRSRWRERHDYTFDHHACYDAPALLHAALHHTNARRAFWIGHSMGGMVGYVLAGRERERIAGLVTLASPARMKADRLLTQLVELVLMWPLDPIPQRFFAQAFAPLATRRFPPVPEFSAMRCNMEIATIRRAMANAIADMPRRLLRQFIEWAVRERPISEHGGVDYRDAISRVTAPLLCIAATGDRLAPPQDVRPGFELVRSGDREWICLGDGGSTDPVGGRCFGHSDIVLGRDAPGLVFPVITRWLESRASALVRRARTG